MYLLGNTEEQFVLVININIWHVTINSALVTWLWKVVGSHTVKGNLWNIAIAHLSKALNPIYSSGSHWDICNLSVCVCVWERERDIQYIAIL